MHAIAIWIVAGQTSLNHISSNDNTAQVIQAASLTSHPHFDRRSLRNDIGIIRLQKALKFRVNVQKVKLPPKGFMVPSGSLTTIAGWGSVQVNLITLKKIHFVLSKLLLIKGWWRNIK